jgi:hypothetical protein
MNQEPRTKNQEPRTKIEWGLIADIQSPDLETKNQEPRTKNGAKVKRLTDYASCAG